MDITLHRILPNGSTEIDVNCDFVCWRQDCIEASYVARGAKATLFIEAGPEIHVYETRDVIKKMIAESEKANDVVVTQTVNAPSKEALVGAVKSLGESVKHDFPETPKNQSIKR